MKGSRIRRFCFVMTLVCLLIANVTSALASESLWMIDLNKGNYLYDFGESSVLRDDLHDMQGISTYNATRSISDSEGEVVLDGKYSYFYCVLMTDITDGCAITVTFMRDEVPIKTYTLDAKSRPVEVKLDVKGCEFFEITVDCTSPYHYESVYFADALFVKDESDNLTNWVTPEYEDYSWINQPDEAVWIEALNPTNSGDIWLKDKAEDKRSNVYQNVYRIAGSKTYASLWETSIMELLLDGEYRNMTGKVFCDPKKDSEGYLLIYGDGKLLYNSGAMTYKSKMKPFNIDVSGVEELHIFGYGSPMYLAEAYFMPVE